MTKRYQQPSLNSICLGILSVHTEKPFTLCYKQEEIEKHNSECVWNIITINLAIHNPIANHVSP